MAQSPLVMVGLACLAASTLLVEVTLTKFFGYKLYHHLTYAVVSMVILSFGAGGLAIFLHPERYPTGEGTDWELAARHGVRYAVSVILALLLVCWIPLDPYTPGLHPVSAMATVPLYFLLLSIPFFHAGLAIGYTLAASREPVTTVYAWDLMGAGLGALLSPACMLHLGGYGSVLAASGLAMLGSAAYARAAGRGLGLRAWGAFALVGVMLLAYPDWARRRYHFDIRSSKDAPLRESFVEKFGGIASTHWNAITRLDISHTRRQADFFFLMGHMPRRRGALREGRLVLMDGGAHTRQFTFDRPLDEVEVLGRSLFAAPYVLHGKAPGRALVLGGGGGGDVVVAKFFDTRAVDVVELNSSTCGLLTGDLPDPERDRYLPFVSSDEETAVTVHNAEGRHFCTTRAPGSYDVIQASGVDTLTAIMSGGKSLVENYLYTVEAVEDYRRLLRPGGVISLTHWRGFTPTFENDAFYPVTSLRMFMIELAALERAGVPDPPRHLCVVGDAFWVEILLKKEPFTPAEMDRIHAWAREAGYPVIFDPLAPAPEVPATPSIAPADLERFYGYLAHADAAGRTSLLELYPKDVSPVDDDRPYFYRTRKRADLAGFFGSESLLMLFVVAILAASLLVFGPLLRVGRTALTGPALREAAFFALCGFAFMLFEITVIQFLSFFVGGPFYSTVVVLVSVLGGYALGSRLSEGLPRGARTFRVLGVVIFAAFALAWAGLPWLRDLCLPLSLPLRLVVAATFTAVLSALTGAPVPLAMGLVRDRDPPLVGWMWGVSSGFNVLGGVCFVPLTQLTGIRMGLLVAGALYLLALLLLTPVPGLPED